MTIKIHHLVVASDGKTCSQLTNIYAETYEQAMLEAQAWHADHFPKLPMLTVKAQPQGFQAGFLRLPGIIEETAMQRWCLKELLAEKGMSMKQVALLSGVSYRTVCRLCYEPLHVARVAIGEALALALGVAPAHLQTTIIVTTEPKRQPKLHARRI